MEFSRREYWSQAPLSMEFSRQEYWSQAPLSMEFSRREYWSQAPLSMEFSRREYWSGLQFPPPEDLPDPGVEPWSPASQADSLPLELHGSPTLALEPFKTLNHIMPSS